MDVERQKNQSLFARGRVALVDFFIIQDTTELAACVLDCCKAGLQSVMIDSALLINGC